MRCDAPLCERLYVNAMLCVFVAVLKAIDLRAGPCVLQVPRSPDEHTARVIVRRQWYQQSKSEI